MKTSKHFGLTGGLLVGLPLLLLACGGGPQTRPFALDDPRLSTDARRWIADAEDAVVVARSRAFAAESDLNSVRAWLEANRLSEYYDNFINEGWETLEDVAGMEQNDLKDCGMIKGGHRKRALKAIGILQVEYYPL